MKKIIRKYKNFDIVLNITITKTKFIFIKKILKKIGLIKKDFLSIEYKYNCEAIPKTNKSHSWIKKALKNIKK